jgi:hypothetical protein
MGELSQREKSKLDNYLSAFVKTRTELSRRILTISSAAVGLVLTLATNLQSPPAEIKVLMGAALVAFVGAVFSTMRSIWIDSDYLIQASFDLESDGRSAETKRLSARTECWGEVGRCFFAAGVIILLVLGIATIQLNG